VALAEQRRELERQQAISSGDADANAGARR
jgi:hypothetical protein